jgi:NAD(P)-dependent dehydrogenase (short-subunit alcohol dehydrogenase family)
MQGSIALVTGGNRGLGKAFVQALLDAGAQKVSGGTRLQNRSTGKCSHSGTVARGHVSTHHETGGKEPVPERPGRLLLTCQGLAGTVPRLESLDKTDVMTLIQTYG